MVTEISDAVAGNLFFQQWPLLWMERPFLWMERPDLIYQEDGER